MKKEKDPAALTYSVAEAARLLGVSAFQAYAYCRRGEIPNIRLGGRVLVPRAALHRMLDEADARRTAYRDGAPHHSLSRMWKSLPLSGSNIAGLIFAH